jgi:hypothetical protein
VHDAGAGTRAREENVCTNTNGNELTVRGERAERRGDSKARQHKRRQQKEKKSEASHRYLSKHSQDTRRAQEEQEQQRLLDPQRRQIAFLSQFARYGTQLIDEF